MPKLETIYFDATGVPNPFGPDQSFAPYPSLDSAPSGDPPLGFIMGLSDCFREAQKLHRMYIVRDPVPTGHDSIFDHLGRPEDLTAIINSYRHCDDDELIHARFLLPSAEEERSEDTRPYIPDGLTPALRHVTEEEREDAHRGEEVEELEDQPETVWTDWTSWGGWVVPLEIIEDMRLEQGATEAEWTGRGIKVGKRAWRVLTEWKEEMEQEQAEWEEMWGDQEERSS